MLVVTINCEFSLPRLIANNIIITSYIDILLLVTLTRHVLKIFFLLL